MNRPLICTGIAVLLALLPFAAAQEPPKEAPPRAPASAKPGAQLFEKCDLNKDGKVDWEEFQKVRSGFAALDADGDGAITEADMAKRAEAMKARIQERVRHEVRDRMQRAMRDRRGDRMREGRRPPMRTRAITCATTMLLAAKRNVCIPMLC